MITSFPDGPSQGRRLRRAAAVATAAGSRVRAALMVRRCSSRT